MNSWVTGILGSWKTSLTAALIAAEQLYQDMAAAGHISWPAIVKAFLIVLLGFSAKDSTVTGAPKQ